jgi:hypothetical protein
MRPLRGMILLGLLLLIAPTTTACAAPDLTADEILAKSQSAMAAPIQYRMTTGGVDSIVSLKDFGGEIGVASRVETVSPQLEQTTITTATYAFEWRPKTGLAIDKTLLGETMIAQATAIRQSVPAGATLRLLEPETIDGVRHYVIETTVPQALADAIAKTLGLKEPLAGTSRSWINAESFQLRRTLSAVGEIEYLDIKQGLDLPNDLFLPPEGMSFEKPNTVDEYIEILTRAARPQASPPINFERRKIAPPFWDPEAKTWKASAPPGWDQKEWEAYVESMPSEPSAIEQPSPPSEEPDTNSRGWLFYANLAILAGLAAYAFARSRRVRSRG